MAEGVKPQVGGQEGDVSIQEAALLYGIEVDDLSLALGALNEEVHRRLVRRGNQVETLYRRQDIEAALAQLAARALGYSG